MAQKGSTRRRWTELGEGSSHFVVASLNVLSPSLLAKHPELYRPEDLRESWSSRLRRCGRELRSYGPDVVCLQEVENPESFARSLGLECAAFAPCAGDRRSDGCAVFYCGRKFHVARAETGVLDAAEDKVNACAVAVLDSKSDRRSLVVATAHLLFNPKRGDLRVRQGTALLAKVAAVVRDAERRKRKVAYLVAGDLNATPDSALYELLAAGKIPPHRARRRGDAHQSLFAEHPHLPGRGHAGHGTSLLGPPRRRSYDKDDDKDDVKDDDQHHREVLFSPLDDLASAYAQPHPRLPPGCPGEPAFTTYIHRGTKGVVDYVFYGQRRLVPVRRLEPPSVSHLRRGLAASVSDHVALVVGLAWTSSSSKGSTFLAPATASPRRSGARRETSRG